MKPLLQVIDVTKTFDAGGTPVRALDGVSFSVSAGECLAVVGESGSGKSTIANIVLGIYQPTSGALLFQDKELPDVRPLALKQAIQLVQQNPLSSLNPRRSVGASIRLALDVHAIGDRAGRKARVGELLEEVGLPADYASRSPAALSGGQRQRVAIARALACQSELLVLDEPTSALDVLVQARVLKLLADIRQARRLTYIFITHDLAVVRNIADRVAVFEKGRLVEIAPTADLFANPSHPYTRRLISAVPVTSRREAELRDRLQEPLDADL